MALLRYNSHTIEFTHLHVYNSMGFLGAELYNHHNNQVQNLLFPQKETQRVTTRGHYSPFLPDP